MTPASVSVKVEETTPINGVKPALDMGLRLFLWIIIEEVIQVN